MSTEQQDTTYLSEAVEAAARAPFDHAGSDDYWDKLGEDEQEAIRDDARRMLAAAYPAIKEKTLRDVAAEIDALPKEDGIAREFLKRSTIRKALEALATLKDQDHVDEEACERCRGSKEICRECRRAVAACLSSDDCDYSSHGTAACPDCGTGKKPTQVDEAGSSEKGSDRKLAEHPSKGDQLRESMLALAEHWHERTYVTDDARQFGRVYARLLLAALTEASADPEGEGE